MYNSVQTGRIDLHLPGTDPTEGKSFHSHTLTLPKGGSTLAFEA